MTVIKKLYTVLFICLISFSIHSCIVQDSEADTESYEILNMLIDKHAKPLLPPPPPLPNTFTYDSVNIKENYYSGHWSSKSDSIIYSNKLDSIKKKNEILSKNIAQIIAIDPYFAVPWLADSNFNFANSPEKQRLYEALKAIQDSIPLRIDRLKITRNDSLTYWSKAQHRRRKGADYVGVDIVASFSRVAFDEKKQKAALVVSFNRSVLAGFSAIYFLEKKDDKWVVIDTKGLWIS